MISARRSFWLAWSLFGVLLALAADTHGWRLLDALAASVALFLAVAP